MLFTQFAKYLQKLEQTSSRLQMTAILAELFKLASKEEIGQLCYLSLGILAPKFEGIEFSMAEKLMIRAIARAVNKSNNGMMIEFKKSGDLGTVIEKLRNLEIEKFKGKPLTIGEVYHQLLAIAQDSGAGSVERKINKMASLLSGLDTLSAKYVVRMALEKLRLGFSDMTILDALSWMDKKDKSLRPELERAFNVLADIGKIAQVFKKEGIKSIKSIKSIIGVPIRPAKAERLQDPEKILEKMKGQCILEPKYDGFRVQIHLDKVKCQMSNVKSKTQNLGLFDERKKKVFVRIFSRNLDNTTAMFPEIVESAQRLPVKSVILDGEAIAFNPKTGKFLPFQETVQRKRKYDVAEKSKELPLKVFVFDILYLDGKSLIGQPFSERRRKLAEIMDRDKATLKTLKDTENTETILLTEQKVVTKRQEFEQFFKQVVNEGLEGLMAKKLDSPYRAGARDFTWVKYKAGMKSELADTIDCVVMGYYRGEGKRSGFGIGAFLVGIINEVSEVSNVPKVSEVNNGKFLTVSKIGTGLTDEQWREMKTRCKKWEISNKPKEYIVDKNLYPDVWCQPKIVVEIEADMITKSPIHTAGLALRFPRLKRFRDDKEPQQTTSLGELKSLV